MTTNEEGAQSPAGNSGAGSQLSSDPILERYATERKRMEEAADKLNAASERHQQLLGRMVLAGTADAGQRQPTEEENVDAEVKRRMAFSGY